MKNNNQNIQKTDLSRLKNFPISFLAICLSLIGFTLTWQKAEQILHLPFSISSYLLYFTLVLMISIILIYILKIIKYPREAKKEFNHPIKTIFAVKNKKLCIGGGRLA